MSTPVPPARIAASNAARSNGSASVAARAPNIAAEMTLPFAFASASMSNAISRLAANSVAIETTAGSPTPSPGRLLFRHRESAMRRGDQRRLFGRDETAQHRSARLHQLGRHHDVDVAGRRHQREDRLRARSRSAPFRYNRSSRRSVARRPAPRWTARPNPAPQRARRSNRRARRRPVRPSREWRSRCAARPAMSLRPDAALVHPRSLANAMRPAFRRRSNQPMIEARVLSTNRSQDEGLWTISAR